MSSEFSDAALARLLKAGQDAVTAKDRVAVIPLPGGRQYALVDCGGQMDSVIQPLNVNVKNIPEPARNHALTTAADVVEFAKHYASDENPVVIWVDEPFIRVCFDRNRLLGDGATYQFVLTSEFAQLVDFSKRTSNSEFTQQQLLTALRTDFWECFDRTEVRDGLITSLRRVSAQQTRSLGQGSGSYEASIVADGQTEKWPDRFLFKLPVFADTSVNTDVNVQIVFNVDAERQKFSLWPTKASIKKAAEDALEAAHDLILNQLESAPNITVFRGEPIAVKDGEDDF